MRPNEVLKGLLTRLKEVISQNILTETSYHRRLTVITSYIERIPNFNKGTWAYRITIGSS